MKSHRSFSRHTETRSVRLDTRRCKACWACVAACPQHVLGKINLPFHKHAHIDQAEKCKGCLRCVKACPNGAIVKTEKAHDNASR
jgi:Fe-S-cluster-containing hydrogenase component 2